MTLEQTVSLENSTGERDRSIHELQCQRMEAIGRLAGGVAHDFNNLLTVISGYTQMLLDDEAVPADTKTVLQDIADASARAGELTRQLLAFSRRQTIRTQPLAINEHVGKLEKLLRRVIGEHIDLMTDLHPAVGSAQLDPSQFDQVILNLVVNARDAMPDGGRVLLRTRRHEFHRPVQIDGVDVPAGVYVRLVVSDTGIGMDAETRAHIFEPFFTTKAGRGTGMGLATVYGIIKQHGGFIFVESVRGRGTTFDVLLPIAGETPTEHTSQDDGDLRRGSETILLVEDEPALRKLTAAMLEREGYLVLEASDGADALQLLGEHDGRVDLVLSDIIMPRMGGPELARHAASRWSGLPFVFMSGYIDESLGQSRSLGAETAFLPKPFTKEHLARKMREVLERTEAAA
jgi:two-component system, cell cycle sensor histidine kinase and response regulator CckA